MSWVSPWITTTPRSAPRRRSSAAEGGGSKIRAPAHLLEQRRRPPAGVQAERPVLSSPRTRMPTPSPSTSHHTRCSALVNAILPRDVGGRSLRAVRDAVMDRCSGVPGSLCSTDTRTRQSRLRGPQTDARHINWRCSSRSRCGSRTPIRCRDAQPTSRSPCRTTRGRLETLRIARQAPRSTFPSWMALLAPRAGFIARLWLSGIARSRRSRQRECLAAMAPAGVRRALRTLRRSGVSGSRGLGVLGVCGV